MRTFRERSPIFAVLIQDGKCCVSGYLHLLQRLTDGIVIIDERTHCLRHQKKQYVVHNRSFTEADAYYYDTYYICICKDEKGNEFEIIIRDCLQENERNFLSGDIITVYGEGAGKISVYDLGYNQYSAPCVNMAYAETVK